MLARAARVDLRRRFDLSLVGGLSNHYESPFFRFLSDEVDPIYSDFAPKPVHPSAVRFYSPRGFYRSLTGRWEPFLTASFTLDFPLGNASAKGRALQAQAALEDSQVQTGDLERVIREHVLAVAGSVEHAREAVARWEAAVAHNETTLAATLERFATGEVTLIDTLLTEEAVTSDQIQLVRARQALASLLTRLKFETGTLVEFEREGTPGEIVTVDTSWLVARTGA